MLDASGLKPPEDFLQRYPQEFSGGQRQRVVIASALILNPMYLVADKPVSMLDVTIQVEILNLLIRLRVEHGITMLYITHDLASAATHISTFFPKKFDGLSFSGFLSPSRIFDAFQSILLRICYIESLFFSELTSHSLLC
ncbi:hypothetical protein ES703_61486 [subsurface metagenome]